MQLGPGGQLALASSPPHDRVPIPGSIQVSEVLDATRRFSRSSYCRFQVVRCTSIFDRIRYYRSTSARDLETGPVSSLASLCWLLFRESPEGVLGLQKIYAQPPASIHRFHTTCINSAGTDELLGSSGEKAGVVNLVIDAASACCTSSSRRRRIQ